MPNSVNDFCSQVNSHVGAVVPGAPTGALFRTQVNSDGTITIYRSVGTSGASGTAGGPSAPWLPAYNRVIYNAVFDTVDVGDGSGQAASSAAAFIAGLN